MHPLPCIPTLKSCVKTFWQPVSMFVVQPQTLDSCYRIPTYIRPTTTAPLKHTHRRLESYLLQALVLLPINLPKLELQIRGGGQKEGPEKSPCLVFPKIEEPLVDLQIVGGSPKRTRALGACLLIYLEVQGTWTWLHNCICNPSIGAMNIELVRS